MGRPRWCTWAAGSVTRSARGRCWTAPTPVSTDGRTHVLLPVGALVRRADAAVVIGAALVAKAAGWGHRRIAVWLDRPASTVRGWLRRFAARAGPLRAAFTTLLCALDLRWRMRWRRSSPRLGRWGAGGAWCWSRVVAVGVGCRRHCGAVAWAFQHGGGAQHQLPLVRRA